MTACLRRRTALPPSRHTVLLALLTMGACRGAPPAEHDTSLARLVDSLRPQVEAVTRLHFKETPRSAMKTRNEVRAFLLQKLDEELPPERMRGIEAAYRLFGLIPDSLDLRTMLLDLYTEQVAGYYDPDHHDPVRRDGSGPGPGPAGDGA